MGLIKGITVQLCVKTPSGTDGFNKQTFTEAYVDVDNVLVGSPTATDITTATELYGRTATYQLAIPKGDTHNWENTKVKFFGETWLTFGIPIQGIDDLVPTDWNKKVMVERYEG